MNTAFSKLQQHLPLAVLKRSISNTRVINLNGVATAPTACGIETQDDTVKSISTLNNVVATAPTACGIETVTEVAKLSTKFLSCNSTYRLRY